VPECPRLPTASQPVQRRSAFGEKHPEVGLATGPAAVEVLGDEE